MSGITLTASMRSNLQSLQKTQSLMDMTQERLSTGNKVNSAIDNPSSYYTAQSLNNRASDLSSLLDSMGQAIQTIKSADQAITSITKFAEQAKAVASSALDSGSLDEIKSYQDQFNSIRNQITQLAGDASYKGVNLLTGDSLTVTFNEGRTSSITVDGQKADATSLGLNEATDWNKTTQATTDAKTALDASKNADITQVQAVKDAQTAYTTEVGKRVDANAPTQAELAAEAPLKAKLDEETAKAQAAKDADIVAKQATYDAAVKADKNQQDSHQCFCKRSRDRY